MPEHNKSEALKKLDIEAMKMLPDRDVSFTEPSERTCGKCQWAVIPSINPVTKAMPQPGVRICFGAPPSCVPQPGPNGQVVYTNMRPSVTVSTPACGLFKQSGSAIV